MLQDMTMADRKLRQAMREARSRVLRKARRQRIAAKRMWLAEA